MAQLLVYDGHSFEAREARTKHDLRWAAWRPRGDYALLSGNAGTLLEYGDGQSHLIPTPTSENLRGVAWHPEGKEALAVGNNGVILRLRDGRVERVPFLSPVALRRVAFHPSGEYALAAGNDGLLVRVDDDGARPIAFGAHHLRAIAWHPDGGYALVGANRGLWRFDSASQELRPLVELPGDAIDVSWHPDGREALVAGFRQGVEIWQREGVLLRWDGVNTTQVELPGTPSPLTGVDWRPGGDYALATSNSGTEPTPSVVYRYQDGESTPLHSDNGTRFIRAFWSHDGAHALVLGSPRARFWSV